MAHRHLTSRRFSGIYGGTTMSNLTASKPFRHLANFNPFPSDWHNLFQNGFFDTVLRTEGQAIPLDVSEDEKSFSVRAAIPGVKKEEIRVAIDGSMVSITAESKEEHSEKQNSKVIVQECYCGNQYRAFSLSQPVDSAKATAKYANGVLELHLPKAAPTSANTIPVQ